ncbi:MAG: DoxX family protein [Acidobacteriota bacterium]
MSFLILMLILSAVAYVPQFFLGDRKDYRMAMRHGMAGGFTFTGIDHFVSAHHRYVPMLPDFMANYTLLLVYLTGAAELAGAIGLVIPLAVYKRLGLPNLRRWAGLGLATLLVFLVVANINVALKGSHVEGLDFGAWYYWLRLFFQPAFILWALFVSEVIWNRSAKVAT